MIYKNSTVFDYFENPLIITSDFSSVKERLSAHLLQHNEDIKLFLEDGTVSTVSDKFYLDEAEMNGYIEKGILLDSFMPSALPLT